MLNILVIEDYYREMEYCCELIKRCLPECNILKAGDQKDAFEILSSVHIDIFFIDVDLPDGNGFNIAERIRKNEKHTMTPIVFVTGMKTNQLEIHRRYHHYEFVEKPYDWKTFSSRVRPMLETLEKEKDEAKKPEKRELILIVETKNQITYVKKSSILYVQAQQRKLTIVTTEKSVTDLHMPLKEFLKKKEWSFLRQSHKSFAVNLENVTSISPDGEKSWMVYFDIGKNMSCPVGVTYYHDIVAAFKELHTVESGG